MLATLKRNIRRVARRAGYEVVPSSDLEDHAFVRHLSKLFDKLDIHCVLDVGANRGQYYRFLRDRVGYGGLVISFEPVAQMVAPVVYLRIVLRIGYQQPGEFHRDITVFPGIGLHGRRGGV